MFHLPKMLHHLFFSPKVVKISCWMNCFFPPEIVKVPLATMFLKSKKKILRLTPQKKGAPHGSCGGFQIIIRSWSSWSDHDLIMIWITKYSWKKGHLVIVINMVISWSRSWSDHDLDHEDRSSWLQSAGWTRTSMDNTQSRVISRNPSLVTRSVRQWECADLWHYAIHLSPGTVVITLSWEILKGGSEHRVQTHQKN